MSMCRVQCISSAQCILKDHTSSLTFSFALSRHWTMTGIGHRWHPVSMLRSLNWLEYNCAVWIEAKPKEKKWLIISGYSLPRKRIAAAKTKAVGSYIWAFMHTCVNMHTFTPGLLKCILFWFRCTKIFSASMNHLMLIRLNVLKL